MASSPVSTRPKLALAMGDAAGVSSELAARVLADPEVRAAAQIIVLGDARVLSQGARIAQVSLNLDNAAAKGGKLPTPLQAPRNNPFSIICG